MAALSIADVPANVTVGVDTHKHSHVARAKDELGRHLGQLEIGTNPAGYADLLAWAQGFGSVVTFGTLIHFRLRKFSQLSNREGIARSKGFLPDACRWLPIVPITIRLDRDFVRAFVLCHFQLPLGFVCQRVPLLSGTRLATSTGQDLHEELSGLR